jgi:hypothetical protein
VVVRMAVLYELLAGAREPRSGPAHPGHPDRPQEPDRPENVKQLA